MELFGWCGFCAVAMMRHKRVTRKVCRRTNKEVGARRAIFGQCWASKLQQTLCSGVTGCFRKSAVSLVRRDGVLYHTIIGSSGCWPDVVFTCCQLCCPHKHCQLNAIAWHTQVISMYTHPRSSSHPHDVRRHQVGAAATLQRAARAFDF